MPSAVTLLSEAVLAEDWLRPEEDEAWLYLQLQRSEQQHLLEKQAADIIVHYQQTAEERNEWQSGDFIDANDSNCHYSRDWNESN